MTTSLQFQHITLPHHRCCFSHQQASSTCYHRQCSCLCTRTPLLHEYLLLPPVPGSFKLSDRFCIPACLCLQVGYYFNKIQCFCFEEQHLRPREVVDMPVFFYIDPEFATDRRLKNIDHLTLSYVFFKTGEVPTMPDGTELTPGESMPEYLLPSRQRGQQPQPQPSAPAEQKEQPQPPASSGDPVSAAPAIPASATMSADVAAR